MAGLWTDAIASGMGTFTELFGDLAPVVGLGVALAVLTVVVGLFTGRSNG